MGLFSIFSKKSDKVKELAAKGAIVVDVRTPAEFQGGHVKGSKNIPLQSFRDRIGEIKKMNKPVILCCASGMRSGQATSMLKKEGVECVNGGGWQKVQQSL